MDNFTKYWIEDVKKELDGYIAEINKPKAEVMAEYNADDYSTYQAVQLGKASAYLDIIKARFDAYFETMNSVRKEGT